MEKNKKIGLIVSFVLIFFILVTFIFLNNFNQQDTQTENITGQFILNNPFSCGNGICTEAKNNPQSPFYCPQDCGNTTPPNYNIFFSNNCPSDDPGCCQYPSFWYHGTCMDPCELPEYFYNGECVAECPPPTEPIDECGIYGDFIEFHQCFPGMHNYQCPLIWDPVIINGIEFSNSCFAYLYYGMSQFTYYIDFGAYYYDDLGYAEPNGPCCAQGGFFDIPIYPYNEYGQECLELPCINECFGPEIIGGTKCPVAAVDICPSNLINRYVEECSPETESSKNFCSWTCPLNRYYDSASNSCVLEEQYLCGGDLPNNSITCHTGDVETDGVWEYIGDGVACQDNTKCKFYCEEEYNFINGQCTSTTGICQDGFVLYDGECIDQSLIPKCGSANKNYPFGSNNFGTDIFCERGEEYPANPAFPSPQVPTNWTCAIEERLVNCRATRSQQSPNSINFFDAKLDGDNLVVEKRCRFDTTAKFEIKNYDESYENEIDCTTQNTTFQITNFNPTEKIIELTLEIEQPCQICIRTIYLTLRDENTQENISINDNNLFLVLLVLIIVSIIVKRKK